MKVTHYVYTAFHTVHTLNLLVSTVKLLDLQLIRLRAHVTSETLFTLGVVWPLRTKRFGLGLYNFLLTCFTVYSFSSFTVNDINK